MDEVGGGVDQVENAVDRLVPVLEKVLFVFDGLEIDDSVDAIDPARDGVQIVQAAEFFFAIVPLHLQQLAHPLQSELAIVFADDADVVLHQHALELCSVVLRKVEHTSWLGYESRKSWKLSILYWSS